MNHFDVAANLALQLTTETGSCHGILTLHNVTLANQIKLFGTILVPWARNAIIIKGVDETVVHQDQHLVFGKRVRKEAVVTRWADLGDQ